MKMLIRKILSLGLLCIIFFPCSSIAADDDDILLIMPAILASANKNKAKIDISLVPLGPGHVSSTGSINYNYDTGGHTTASVLRDSSKTMVFTAFPKSGAVIDSWRGCDSLSADNTRCTVNLGNDQVVGVVFKDENVSLKNPVVDLTSADVSTTGAEYIVSIDPSNTDLLSEVQSLAVGDFIVSSSGQGFLRQVAAIENLGTYSYALTTDFASLEDVIEKGTGIFTKQMTHGDLAGATLDEPQPDTKQIGRLRASADKNDSVFTIELVSPQQGTGSEEDLKSEGISESDSVVLYDDGVNKVEISGTIDMEIDVDVGVSFGITGLKEYHFIPRVTTSENITLSVTGSVDSNWEKQLESLSFGHLTFSVGPIPVVLTFQLDMAFGAQVNVDTNITTALDVETDIAGGINYNRDTTPSFSWVREVSQNTTFTPPEFEADLSAKAYIKLTPKILIYKVTGPAIELEPSLNLNAGANLDYYCNGGVNFESSFDLKAQFYWDMSADSVLGDILNLDELQEASRFTIAEKSWPIKSWNYGGQCNNSPGQLELSGGIWQIEHPYDSSQTYTRAVTLKNSGGKSLNWSSVNIWPSCIDVNPSSGILAANAEQVVNLTLDPDGLNLLWPWPHYRSIGFKKGYLSFPQFQNIIVKVTPPELSPPTMTPPVLSGETTVALSWDYNDANTAEYVAGYMIYESANDGDYYAVQKTGSGTETCILSSREPGNTYKYKAITIGYVGNQSDPSAEQQIAIPEPVNEKPEGDVSGFGSSCLIGDTVSYTLSGTDDNAIAQMRFRVFDPYGVETHQQDMNFSGTSTSESANGSFDTSGWTAGEYSAALSVIDNDGVSSTFAKTFTLQSAGSPFLTITAPAGGGSFTMGDTVTIQWNSSNMQASDKIVLSVKRDSASSLTWPDNVNWYRFTDHGFDDANDGEQSVVLPASLADGKSDWRFYVGYKEDNNNIYDASGNTCTINSSNNNTQCGAYVAPGVWKKFDCYNLAAIGKTTNDDPFTPSWRLIGGYWQWGRKGPDSSSWYNTNTANFAHGPTGPDSGDANSGRISDWDTSYAPDGSWSNSVKTANDPCPSGYRLPTYSQWTGVDVNNTQSTVGTWSISATNYSSGRFFGDSLMLPAAGYRHYSSGSLYARGYYGYYCSSTQYSGSSDDAWNLYFSSSNASTSYSYRRYGDSVRCAAAE